MASTTNIVKIFWLKRRPLSGAIIFPGVGWKMTPRKIAICDTSRHYDMRARFGSWLIAYCELLRLPINLLPWKYSPAELPESIGETMNDQTWQLIKRSMRKNRKLKQKSYVVESIDEKRITLIRIATGSKVTATRKMISRTLERLESGETIPKRGISYTVAIEFSVVSALESINAISINSTNYSKA